MVAETFDEDALPAENDNADWKPWIINSGCSSNFSLNCSEFIDYAPYTSLQKICLGDSCIIPSLGEGTTSLTCIINQKPITCLIHSMQYVLALTYALLSCRALTHWGLRVIFNNDTCSICHRDGTLIAKSSGVPDQLYFLNVIKGTIASKPESDTTLTITLSFDLAHK